jgi:hypothetical protein
VDFTVTAPALISIINVVNGGNFLSGNLYSTASFQAKVVDASGNPVSGATVTWSVLSAQNNAPAMMSGWGSKKTGLTWGNVPEVLTYVELQQERISSASSPTAATSGAGETPVQQLTDIVGQREITIQAKVNIGGTDYTATQPVSFGNGPLSVFRATVGMAMTWDNAYQTCNGTAYPSADHSTGWSSGTYVGGGKMPTRVEYQAVSPYNVPPGWTNNPNTAAQGAAVAAGWPSNYYWSGEANGADLAFIVGLDDGNVSWDSVSYYRPVACRR